MPTKIDYLSTYLQDHRAGATTGLALAQRMADENSGTPCEEFLVALAQQIDEDVSTQEAEMLRSGVQGKLSLWDALLEVSGEDPRLDAEQLHALVARAETQLVGLREHHAIAAGQAFGG